MADVTGLKLNGEKIATFSSGGGKCYLHVLNFRFSVPSGSPPWKETTVAANVYLSTETKFATVKELISYLYSIYGKTYVNITNLISAYNDIYISESGYSYKINLLAIVYKNNTLGLYAKSTPSGRNDVWVPSTQVFDLTESDTPRPSSNTEVRYYIDFQGDTVVEVPYPNMV